MSKDHAEPNKYITIQTATDVEGYMNKIRVSARDVSDWIAGQSGNPMELLRQIKFDDVGRHPIQDRRLNFIEQVNQTWTYLTALAAARQLLILHPDAGGFHLAPGAHASLDLDIMSVNEGQVGAETFAAVDPNNNDKLKKDCAKMAARSEKHRYVFFMSPKFPLAGRLTQFERDGVQVWCVTY